MTTYLLAVVSSILHTNQVSIGPSIQICILATDMAVSSITGPALAAVHGICKVSKVVAAGIFVAVMASIKAGIAGCAYLDSEGEIDQMSMILPTKQSCAYLICYQYRYEHMSHELTFLSEHLFFAALQLAA